MPLNQERRQPRRTASRGTRFVPPTGFSELRQPHLPSDESLRQDVILEERFLLSRRATLRDIADTRRHICLLNSERDFDG